MARNLKNVLDMISKECFMREVFPLLEGLCADKEKDVKISCIK